MSLLTRILTEKRLVVTLVALALLLGVALYTLGVYPQTVRLREARQRQSAAAQALIAAQRDYDVAEATMEEKAEVTQELERFYREILPPNLSGARGITYPRLAALARGHGLVMERRSSVSEQDENSDLARLRTSTILAGEWSSIRRFIDDLESGPEFIIIEDIVLNQSEDVDASLALTIGLATYYRADNGV